MHIGEIAEAFIRAAEIERLAPGHIGPALPHSLALPYVHDFADKAGWGTKRLEEERQAFWDRLGRMPSAAELTSLEAIFDWLRSTDNDGERRALLAWARAKAGGKSFRRWCFKVEGIHPETGRRRKDRALAKIQAKVSGRTMQHDDNREIRVLLSGAEISDVSDTIAEDAGKRDNLNSWLADDAFAPFMSNEPQAAFSWAKKRNEQRRQREARRQKQAA